ncbi:MAG: hypothetical protein OEZ36_11335, partial [Spirochaetota bacterium]|nr:hypothetical protein [Spirochaetota bacterium]
MMDHSKRCLDWQSIVEKLKNMAFSEPGVLEADEMSFSDDPSVVRNKLGECREMKQILEESQPPDVEIWDISRELARCQKKDSYLFADEIIKVAKSLKGSRMMKEYILDFKDRVQLIIQIAEGISGFRSLENKAFQSIDEDQKITDNASKELKNIRQDIRRLKSSIEKRLKNVLNNPDNSHLIQDNIVTVRENRYVIPIKKDHKGKLKGIV